MNKIFEECIKEFQLDSKKQLLAFKLNGVKKGYEILYGGAEPDTPEGEYRRCLFIDADKIFDRIENASTIEELEVLDKEIEEVRKELF